eukprot:4920872-Amphidinium_carterae.2
MCTQIQPQEYGWLTKETVTALMMTTPGSSKTHATLQHQSPETCDAWMATIASIKAAWEEERAATGAVSATTNVSGTSTVIEVKSLAEDVEVSIKKIKRSDCSAFQHDLMRSSAIHNHCDLPLAGRRPRPTLSGN